MKHKVPKYLSQLIELYPTILSGRKKVKEHHERIIKTKELIKKFKSKKLVSLFSKKIY